eukprot:7106686-Pyramimonas_sp.AAC.1
MTTCSDQALNRMRRSIASSAARIAQKRLGVTRVLSAPPSSSAPSATMLPRESSDGLAQQQAHRG